MESVHSQRFEFRAGVVLKSATVPLHLCYKTKYLTLSATSLCFVHSSGAITIGASACGIIIKIGILSLILFLQMASRDDKHVA